MLDAESYDDLNKIIEKEVMKGLRLSGTAIKQVLQKTIMSDWYGRSRYGGYGAITPMYIRTYQLPYAVSYEDMKQTTGISIFVDSEQLKPTTGLVGMFNSYMNWYGEESSNGKTVAEWVTEWIETSNANPSTQPSAKVYTKTEKTLISKDIPEKELIRQLKNLGIKAVKA